MLSSENILFNLGLGTATDDGGIQRDPTTGTLTESGETRLVCAPRDFVRSLHFVLEREKPGTWQSILKATGATGGKAIATQLDAQLAELGQPALNSLPLESCLILLERLLAQHGWGRLKLDLADAAEHGLVVARLEASAFVDALDNTEDFVDALLAGKLQGFFEHISGQTLGCEEISCARRSEPGGAGRPAHCTFVITAPERLEKILPLLGRESGDAILARLKT